MVLAAVFTVPVLIVVTLNVTSPVWSFDTSQISYNANTNQYQGSFSASPPADHMHLSGKFQLLSGTTITSLGYICFASCTQSWPLNQPYLFPTIYNFNNMPTGQSIAIPGPKGTFYVYKYDSLTLIVYGKYYTSGGSPYGTAMVLYNTLTVNNYYIFRIKKSAESTSGERTQACNLAKSQYSSVSVVMYYDQSWDCTFNSWSSTNIFTTVAVTVAVGNIYGDYIVVDMGTYKIYVGYGFKIGSTGNIYASPVG